MENLSLIGIILRWGFLIWELIFFFIYLLQTFFSHLGSFCVVSSFHYVSAKFHLWPSSGDLPRPRIGILSLVTVSPVVTAFHSCCLSHHVFDQVNLWPAWVGFETAIFWQCSPDCHSWWISKMQSDTLEERYSIKFCFKLGKNTTETYGMLQTAFRPSCRTIEHQFLSVIRDSKEAGGLWGMLRGEGGVRKSVHQSWLAKGLGLGLLCWGFKGVQEEIPSEEASTLQIGSDHFHQDNAPVHNSILVTDYLTKMGIETVPQPP